MEIPESEWHTVVVLVVDNAAEVVKGVTLVLLNDYTHLRVDYFILIPHSTSSGGVRSPKISGSNCRLSN